MNIVNGTARMCPAFFDPEIIVELEKHHHLCDACGLNNQWWFAVELTKKQKYEKLDLHG